MTQQYLRKVSLVVGDPSGKGLDLSELRFKFQIRRGDYQTPNSAVVRVYNLSQETTKRLRAKEFSILTLRAGYETNYGIIFQGTIKYKFQGHESNIDSYLDFVAADGDSAYTHATMNTSLSAGSRAADHLRVIEESTAKFGVTAARVQPPLSTTELPRGKVFYGMARDYARTLARNSDATWSIQDGKLQLILQTSYLPGAPIVLTAATGLIGFPEETLNGVRVRCLLNPAVKIGTLLKIDNASLNPAHLDVSLQSNIQEHFLELMRSNDGLYKVLVAEHQGDTRGNVFYTDITCISVNGSIPPGSPLIYKEAVAPYGP